MEKKQLTSLTFSFLFILLLMASCRKDKAELKLKPVTVTDNYLYERAKETSGFIWFKNSPALLDKSSGTGHSQPYLKTRYNDTAAAMLDVTGRIKPDISFPEGSLIVKELYTDATTLERYAVLYKKSNSTTADENGWVWGYILADGTVAAAASSKGSGCIGCHTQSGHIDYMLMNKFFP